MKGSRVKRVLGLAGMLALAFSGGAALLRHERSFSGEIYVAEGSAERVVIRPALRPGPGRTRGADRIESAAPVEIPFETPTLPSRKLDPKQLYDAIVLSFSIRLTEVETLGECPVHHSIKTTLPEGETEREIAVGDEVDVADKRFRVEGIRKWSGLLSEPTGMTLACVSIARDDGECTEDVFVLADRWLRMEPGLAMLFSWTNSEETARAAVARLPGIDAARWGIADRGGMSWFSSFAPGLGATLSDGTSVTLIQFDENHVSEAGVAPAIEVRFDGANRETMWVNANDTTPNARVRFEFPTRLPSVVLAYAWREGWALFAAYQDGRKCGEQVIQSGYSWRPHGFPFELRLENVMEKGVPVSRENSVLYEAVLTGGTERLRLREGEAVRRGDALVEFVRVAEPPTMRYTFAATGEGVDGDREFTVGPGDRVQVGQWTFSLIPGSPDPGRCAVLWAERTMGAGWVYAPLVLGVVALVLMLMGVRKWGSGPVGF